MVVGAGPAGLFACLDLAQRGLPPLLIERGEPVQQRRLHVRDFRRHGELNPSSNMVFGEGGAGAFSDGKVYTRSRSEHAATVLRWLVELGEPADILVDATPHIGTDRLAVLLSNLRARLTELGAEIRFGTELKGIRTAGQKLTGIELGDGEYVETRSLILAIGHNAADSIGALNRCGLPMQAQSTAIGVRIEHRQRDVDRWLYGGERGELPPGFYRVVMKPSARQPRPVYSFCMCPGGVVVAAPERMGCVVTNGMSASRRSGTYANAALIVPVDEREFARHGGADDALRGLRFLQQLEAAAWERGGGGFVAPAQLAADMLAGRPTEQVPACTYRPGIVGTELASLLPADVGRSLCAALEQLERRWPGFASGDALLVGLETRTSSPVRIIRSEDGQSVGVAGVFPAGEGAGYAGGILSAAADGVRAARCLADTLPRGIQRSAD